MKAEYWLYNQSQVAAEQNTMLCKSWSHSRVKKSKSRKKYSLEMKYWVISTHISPYIFLNFGN